MGIGIRAARLVLAIATATATAATSGPVSAAPAPVAAGEPPCTMFALEGDAPREAEELSTAIVRALDRRSLDDGRRVSLDELRLAMGCEGDAPECLAKGGKSLGSQRILYGTIDRRGTGFSVSLAVLDVASASVIRSSTTPLGTAELAEANVEATANDLVAALFPGAHELVAEPIPRGAPPELAPTGPARADAPAPRDALVWGLHRPMPTWKIAAVGTSAGITVVFLAAAIGTTVALHTTLRNKLLDEVDASHEDDNPNNDIDRSEGDLCGAARATPPNEPSANKVTNAKVTQVCNTADGVRRSALGLWIASGVGLLATAAFTTLLFVRRGPPSPQTARRLRLELDAGRGRLGLGLRGRF